MALLLKDLVVKILPHIEMAWRGDIPEEGMVVLFLIVKTT